MKVQLHSELNLRQIMAPIILIPNNLLERVVGRKQLDLVLVDQLLNLEQRDAHLDA